MRNKVGRISAWIALLYIVNEGRAKVLKIGVNKVARKLENHKYKENDRDIFWANTRKTKFIYKVCKLNDVSQIRISTFINAYVINQ